MSPTEVLYFVIIDWVLLFIYHWSLCCSCMSVQYIKGAILLYRHTQVLQSCTCLRVDRHSGSLWVSGCLMNRVRLSDESCQPVWWIVSGCLMNCECQAVWWIVSGCLMNCEYQAVWWIVSGCLMNRVRLCDELCQAVWLIVSVRLSDESWVSGCLINRDGQAVWWIVSFRLSDESWWSGCLYNP
jgi:hypothetical protein